MASSPSQLVRLVSKERYNEQYWVHIPAPTNKLSTASVRIQPTYVAVSANNLAYCAAGDVLHWWSAFGAPPQCPPPYNDTRSYGIAPGWGYGRVTESTISNIPKDAIVAGFVPLSGHAFDLSLEPTGRAGDFVDVTKSRSKMMSLYHRYTVLQPGTDIVKSEILVWQQILKVWEAGYFLVKYVFPARGSPWSTKPVHPLGIPVSPWTSEMADLAGSLLVLVASGTKTARSFLELLSLRDAKDGIPQVVVEITNGRGASEYISQQKWTHELMKYDDVGTTSLFSQISSHIRKVVVLEFGGRDGAIASVDDAIKAALPGRDSIVIKIGSEAKVLDSAVASVRAERMTSVNAIQMNTSGVKDVTIAQEGEDAAFRAIDHEFSNMVRRQTQQYDGKVLGVTFPGIAGGLQGDKSIDDTWQRLSVGGLSGDEGLLFRLE